MYRFFIKRKAWLRSIAITLLLSITFQLFLPAAAWALTAGPTAPEFSSFEPIDTTDMVNLQTGDFTYNIPLLEVPGPEGGYPLALSYHAGINPDEEASWVGLGWTLNPGAISRTTNFYPDDVAGSVRTVHDHWNGGDRTTYSFGLGYCGIGIDVAIANDTYKGEGFGVGMGGSYSYAFLNGSIGVSPDPYGESSNDYYGSLGVGMAGAGVGIAANSQETFTYASASTPLLGASISSSRRGGNVNVAGASFNQINNNAGKVSSNGMSMGVTMPIYFFTLNLGYSYMRYWSDERDNVNTYGSLHADLASNNFGPNASFDSYALIDQSDAANLTVEPQHQVGGSFPAYDFYSVMGQGIGGYMQPYLFEQGSLYRQNVTSNGNVKAITYQNTSSFTKKAQFRFKNDFSNAIQRDANGNLQVKSAGFNSGKNHLAGSRHIEWFTNAQIVSGDAKANYGFVPHESAAITKKFNDVTYYVESQAGGFMITNESGVSYHYALPVYAYGEYQKFTTSDGISNSYRENINGQPYAYNWLLTAVTGPDYVDMGNPGLDESDYGYWVKFNYGQWTDAYKWRSPYTGTKKDIDKNISYYSKGKKEVYYLDAIETRSHIALFVKDIRKDGFSIGDPDNGGLLAKTSNKLCLAKGDYDNYKNKTSLSNNLQEYPLMSLKLSRIVLMTKENFYELGNYSSIPAIKNAGQEKTMEYDVELTWPYTTYPLNLVDCIEPVIKKDRVGHFYENVIMEKDIAEVGLSSNILREIDFTTDNSLCNNTPNSLESPLDIYSTNYLVAPNSGKLTLKGITYRGKGGVANIPPMIFSYGAAIDGKNPDYDRDKVDMWGSYKSDIDKALLEKNENAAKYVSDVSAQYVDAWSLKEITTSLGAKIKIDYESDVYDGVELAKQNLFTVKKIDHVPLSNKIRIYLNNDTGFDISKYYKPGDVFGMKFVECFETTQLITLEVKEIVKACDVATQLDPSTTYFPVYRSLNQLPIHLVNTEESYIEIDDPYVYNDFAQSEFEDNKLFPCTIDDFGGMVLRKVKFRTATWPAFIATGVTFSPTKTQNGGGLRVKSISVNTNANEYNKTAYSYANGSTSYEPFGILKAVNTIEPRDNNRADAKALGMLDKHMGELYNSVLFNARELPGAGVFYGKTTITEYVGHNATEKQIPGRREYVFDNFDVDNASKSMYDYYQRNIEDVGSLPVLTYAGGVTVNITSTLQGTHHKEVTIKDYTSRAGILRSVTDYGLNDQKINEVKYTYMHDSGPDNDSVNRTLSQKFFNQGLVHQTFREQRSVDGIGNNMEAVSHRYDYPAILLKTTTNNYTSGLATESQNLAFDFYSGMPVKSISKDSYGNSFMSVATPAYSKYGEMGLKVKNPLNKHMLTQQAQQAVFKITSMADTTKVGLVAASATVWSNNIKVIGVANTLQEAVWRKQKSYVWQGSPSIDLNKDGTFSITDYGDHLFSFGNSTTIDGRWLKTGETTLTDAYSHVLEEKNLNNNYAAVKMDNNNRHVIVYASNANYNEVFYSGTETLNSTGSEGGVSKGEGTLSNAFSHTGTFSLSVASGKKGFNVVLDKTKAVLSPSKKYLASVWVYLPNSNEIGSVGISSSGDKAKAMSVGSETKKAGSWYLIQRVIEPGTADITIECKNNSGQPVYFDDFKVQPLAAISSAYVYDKATGELTYLLNNDGLYTRFVYNTDGKLSRVYKERFLVQGEVLTSEFKMSYKK